MHCTFCGVTVPLARHSLGYETCLECGEQVETFLYYGLTDSQREFIRKHERVHELLRKPPSERTVIEIYEFLLLCS